MTLNPGEEFKLQATPSPELLRKLSYLAEQDNGSVLTPGRSAAGTERSSSERAARRADTMLQMARLSDSAYQAVSERISQRLDLMDEASVHALQQIEQELLEVRRQRERMLEQAWRDERGRAVFMTEDQTGAYYEDGSQVDDDAFTAMQPQLTGRPTWEAWRESSQREQSLLTERDDIHAHEAARADLRSDLAEGAVSAEEAEQREQELEVSTPERVRVSYAAFSGHAAEPASAAPVSAEEQARLAVRGSPEADGDASAVQQPAAPLRTPGLN